MSPTRRDAFLDRATTSTRTTPSVELELPADRPDAAEHRPIVGPWHCPPSPEGGGQAGTVRPHRGGEPSARRHRRASDEWTGTIDCSARTVEIHLRHRSDDTGAGPRSGYWSTPCLKRARSTSTSPPGKPGNPGLLRRPGSSYYEKTPHGTRRRPRSGRCSKPKRHARGRHDPPVQRAGTHRRLFVLMLGGIDTTWSTLGASLFRLGARRAPGHPRRHPDLIPTAVEKSLRLLHAGVDRRVIAEDVPGSRAAR